jgi:hypothetical protein
MTEKLREQAELRYEQEQREQRLRAEAEREAEKESGIRDHIERIQKQRDEERREQARQGAEVEADDLARERYELEERLEEAAMTMNRTLAELQSLHGRQGDALRRAGRPLGHDYRLSDVITAWWKDRFGSPNSLTSTPVGHMDSMGRHEERKRKSLPELDPLADVTSYDDEEAS